ncbi:MAG: branched-chain amino acid ABC transporter permease [Dethiobacter sp.]|jgi:branched-chain amino acid transport system permease protein|nr:MAG: branched-chain amino acid ABC transporter permease [Dethiobacter sp.]
MACLHSWKTFLTGAIAVVFLALLPLLADMGDDTMNLLIMLFIYIILAESWNLMGGYTGLYNIGMAAFFGCGVLITHFVLIAGAPLYIAVLGGAVSAVLLAGVIGIPTLKLKGFYFSIATLALAEVLRITVGNLFPRTVWMPSEWFVNFNFIPRYYLSLGMAVITVLIMYILVNSKLGLALFAIRDDEEAAKVSGINVFKYKIIVFFISSFLTGLAGGIYTYYRLSFLPFSQFTPHWTFEPLMAASIGGAGTILGPVLGSILLVVIQDWFSLNLGQAHYIVLGTIFILMVIFSPGGIIQLVNKAYHISGLYKVRKKRNRVELF